MEHQSRLPPCLYPSVLLFQASNFTKSDNSFKCNHAALCTVASRSKTKRRTFIWSSFCSLDQLILVSHAPSRVMDEFLIASLSMQTLLWPMEVFSFVFHHPWQHWRIVSDCVLPGTFNGTLDCSDDPAQLHHCVLNETIRLLVASDRALCCLFCPAPLRDSVSQSDDGQLFVALQRDFTISERIDELHDSFDCPRLFDAFCQDPCP